MTDSSPGIRDEKIITIFCHGFTTNKDGNTNQQLEVILDRVGLAVFRFDFFGHGESEGSLDQITTSHAVDNVLKAAEFVQTLGYKKTILYGSSFGGMASLLAAPGIKNLKAMALKSPVTDYPGSLFSRLNKSELDTWEKNGYHTFIDGKGAKQRINYSFFQDAASLNVYQILSRISIPVLIVHGDQDEIVPVEQSRKTALLLPDSRLEVIKGADHTYSQSRHFNRMIEFISRFFIGFNPRN